jgi:HEAT repeat protein
MVLVRRAATSRRRQRSGAWRVVRRYDWLTTVSVAAWALGELKASTAVTALVEALRDRAGPVRSVAAKALGGDIGDTSAVDALVAALGDRMADVRQLAAWALGESRDPRPIDALSAMLSDDDPAVRRLAAQSLKKLRR